MTKTDKKPSISQRMIKTAFVYIFLFTSLLLCAFLVAKLIGIQTIELSFSSWLGIVGLFLALLGNNYVSDAVTRWGAKNTILWKYGNILQSLGFAITLLALIIK